MAGALMSLVTSDMHHVQSGYACEVFEGNTMSYGDWLERVVIYADTITSVRYVDQDVDTPLTFTQLEDKWYVANLDATRTLSSIRLIVDGINVRVFSLQMVTSHPDIHPNLSETRIVKLSQLKLKMGDYNERTPYTHLEWFEGVNSLTFNIYGTTLVNIPDRIAMHAHELLCGMKNTTILGSGTYINNPALTVNSSGVHIPAPTSYYSYSLNPTASPGSYPSIGY